jgi:hypothetical protein
MLEKERFEIDTRVQTPELEQKPALILILVVRETRGHISWREPLQQVLFREAASKSGEGKFAITALFQ